MAIRIIGGESHEEAVRIDLIIQTIERNRDRVRMTCSSLLTTSGILVSFLTAAFLFTNTQGRLTWTTGTLFGAGIASFFVSAAVAVFSGSLRARYDVTTEAQFVSDLLTLLDTEIRWSRIAIVLAGCGLLLLMSAVLTVIASPMPIHA